MIPQFSNKATLSTFLWAENRLGNDLQAYVNYTSPLYYQEDASIGTGYVAYAAPFKQWVYDSGVQGATILNSVTSNIGTISRGQSGMKVDYNNGRIILDAAVGTGLQITGSYAFKEINVYYSNEDQESVLTSDQYYLNPRFQSLPTGATPPNTIATPAVFVSLLNNKNDPWALGGLDMSTYNMSLVVMTETSSQMRAILGSFNDSFHHYIPIVDPQDDPINEWGDLKISGYNYNDIKTLRGTPGNLMNIKSVHTSQISDKAARLSPLNQALYMGIVDIDVIYPRLTQ